MSYLGLANLSGLACLQIGNPGGYNRNVSVFIVWILLSKHVSADHSLLIPCLLFLHEMSHDLFRGSPLHLAELLDERLLYSFNDELLLVIVIGYVSTLIY